MTPRKKKKKKGERQRAPTGPEIIKQKRRGWLACEREVAKRPWANDKKKLANVYGVDHYTRRRWQKDSKKAPNAHIDTIRETLRVLKEGGKAPSWGRVREDVAWVYHPDEEEGQLNMSKSTQELYKKSRQQTLPMDLPPAPKPEPEPEPEPEPQPTSLSDELADMVLKRLSNKKLMTELWNRLEGHHPTQGDQRR